MDRRTALTSLGAALATTSALAQQPPAHKSKIAVLGTGHLGQILAKGWVKAGHPIVYGSRTPEDAKVGKVVQDTGSGVSVTTNKEAAAQSEIIVFALPWKPVKELVAGLGDLSGKILIDPMNSVKMVDGYPVLADVTTSVGEELQSYAPTAHVVKAFNTPDASNIAHPEQVSGGKVSIPLAGADATAKARVAELVSELGLEPVDTGPLIASRYLEGMMLVSLGYYFYGKRTKSFEYYLAPVRQRT